MAWYGRGHGRLGAQRDVVPVVLVVATAVVPPWLPSPTHKGSCSRRRRWSLTKAIGTATTMSTRAVAAPRSRPHKPRTSNHGAAGGFDHGDHDVAVIGSHAAAAGGLGDLTGGGRLRARQPRRGGDRVSCGDSRRPRRSRWRRAALTMAATASTTAARHQWLPARI
jgi:hypothetical protein